MWRAVVRFLKFKPGSLLPLIVLATGLSLLVVPVGYAAYHLGRQVIPGRASVAGESIKEAQAPKNANMGQHNLLLVLVDSLDQPDLEGVWLVVNGNLSNGSKFLPVEFTAPSGKEESRRDDSRTGFFNSDGTPTGRFVDELIGRGLWWDYYLVMDLSGLGALTGWPGRSHPQPSAIPSGFNLEEAEKNITTGRMSIYQQAVTLRSLCERSQLINQTMDHNAILLLLDGHFRTDYELARLGEDWYSFRNRGFAWYCEFPTIKEVSFLEKEYGNE